jgi:hypothetical protein
MNFHASRHWMKISPKPNELSISESLSLSATATTWTVFTSAVTLHFTIECKYARFTNLSDGWVIWQQLEHLINRVENFSVHIESTSPSSSRLQASKSMLSGGTVLKVWSKDINCFFSVSAKGKKQRLKFSSFHLKHFDMEVWLCATTNTKSRITGIVRCWCMREWLHGV